MERDYDKEINALKEQMQNLQNRVSSQLDELRTVITKENYHEASSKKLERVHVMQEMHPDKRLSEQMKELCCETEERGVSGLVTYLGVYTSGGRQSNWIRNAVSVDDLLSLIDEGVAGKVLACVGNESRLTILLEILRGPKTVAELVEKCHYYLSHEKERIDIARNGYEEVCARHTYEIRLTELFSLAFGI